MKHCITLDDWTRQDFINLFTDVDYIIKAGRWRQAGTNYTIANLFYEPSTRTSSSFYAAAKRLGMDVIQINNVQYSSVAKGESLEDTIKTLACYTDGIVLRHTEIGAAKRAAEVSSVPIINAGDGAGEHPTQTLLDLYTIYKHSGKIDNLKITMYGDLKNSRTIHSLVKALAKFDNVYINFVAPNALQIPAEYCKNLGNDGAVDHSLTRYIAKNTDVLYITRVQTERGSIGNYNITSEDMEALSETGIIMHPFPRNNEIPTWVDDDTRAKYFDQIKNGLYVRMSLLRTLIS
jgi:aspartate carbamoyltransferase